MEIRHLRSFVTVAENLHFSRSADELGISAPTLTGQIQELERLLHARLFSRTKRSVALTAVGEAFLPEARATLQQLERARQVGLRAGRGQVACIEVGYVGAAAFVGVLQDQVGRFLARRPEVTISTKELPTEQLIQLVDEGRIDLAFVVTPAALPPSITTHVLARDEFCLALPAHHLLAQTGDEIDAGVLREEIFVVPEQTLGLSELARRGKFAPRIVSAPGTMISVITQVALGLGVAVVPSVLAEGMRMPNVVFKKLAAPAIISEIEAVFRSHERSPTVRDLIEQILSMMPRSA